MAMWRQCGARFQPPLYTEEGFIAITDTEMNRRIEHSETAQLCFVQIVIAEAIAGSVRKMRLPRKTPGAISFWAVGIAEKKTLLNSIIDLIMIYPFLVLNR